MSVYLSEFRPRQVNEQHYDQKMKFWKQMIENFCEYKGSAGFSIEELKINFKRNGTSPYCLQTVVNDMSFEKNLVPKDDFMQKPKGWTGWAVDSLVKPLSWSLTKVKEKIIASPDAEKKTFIVKSVLRAQSKLLYEEIKQRHSANLISMDELMKTVEQIDGISKEGALFALQHLSIEEKKVFIEEENPSNPHHKILLKFAEFHKPVSPISDIERSIYNLEHTEIYLKREVDELEARIDDSIKSALECKRDGKTKLALVHMKRKHRMEDDIMKKLTVLENIQNMLQTIRTSSDDKEILETYRMGSTAIKTTFSASGIDLDNVHDIIEEMQEIFTNQEECQQALSEPISGLHKYDDAELEKELQDLAKSNEKDANHKPDPAGGYKPPNIVELDNLDRELEERLRRLRSDFDDPTSPQKQQKPAARIQS